MIPQKRGGYAMRELLSPWQKILKIVIRDLFRKAYQKKELPDEIEIEIGLEYFEQDYSLFIRTIDYCLDIGWGSAALKKKREEEKSIFLVLKRVQKRCSSG